jgi:hypothetical protein
MHRMVASEHYRLLRVQEFPLLHLMLAEVALSELYNERTYPDKEGKQHAVGTH